MFNVSRTNEPVQETLDTLEKVLTEMTKYGKPRISFQGDGWYSCIVMNTNADGVSFDIQSEFKHKTPADALFQCRERMMAVISQYKDMK